MHIDDMVRAIALIPQAIKLLEQLMTTQAELDAKLDALSEDIDKVIVLVPELQTAIADLNAKIGTVTTVDLTPETDKVNALIAKLTGILPAPALEPTPTVAGTADPTAVAPAP